MNASVAGKLTVCVLDYNRPAESERCLRSIHQHLTMPRDQWQVLYLSNGGEQRHAQRWYDEGLIDTLVLNRANWGCGVAMKQMAAAALTEWVMLVQSDQYLMRSFTELDFTWMVNMLNHPNGQSILYFDLAGNQGQGHYSERAHLISRRRYLDTPGLDDTIGGPGPFAQSKWTEQHMQEHMRSASLAFVSDPKTYYFADNGAWSEREYPAEYGIDGAYPRTKHRTDTKRLWVLSPFGRRADGFPNLNLTDAEWAEVLNGQWPTEGKIPEKDRAHSFVAWPE